MAMDEKKRQKKLAKQKKKRKEKKSLLKSEISLISSMSALTASRFPIYECYMASSIFEIGLGPIVVSRQLENGDIAMSLFLLDILCLGVKNCLFVVCSAKDFKLRVEYISSDEPSEKISPEYARKIVEDCVKFAKKFGFNPHPDYAEAYPIFGNIDATKCTEIFEFGKDGEPVFISGPDDDEETRDRILLQLQSKNK